MKDSGSATCVKATGIIEMLGMSSFQYGTHILKAAKKSYALKSSTINLDSYLDKRVTMKGKRVDGYPLEAGPERSLK
ncbi:hypothetical protein ACVWYG_000283 [Pedobacter sp. UYEF25]